MVKRIVWDPITREQARAMAAKGFGPTRIGVELGYDYKTVKRQFALMGEAVGSGTNGWASQEVAILKRGIEAGLDCPAISAELAKAGFKRTAGACRTKALSLDVDRPPALKPAPVASLSWPVMRGDDEERDARFVRLVRAAGGTPVSVKGVGWVYPYRAEHHELAWRLGLLSPEAEKEAA